LFSPPAQGGAGLPSPTSPSSCSLFPIPCAYNCREPREGRFETDSCRNDDRLLGCAVGLAQQKEPCATAGPTTPSLASRPSSCGPATRPRPRATPARIRPRSPLQPHWGDGNGSAVIVMPGGGTWAGRVHEGREFADWFTERGFHAFILSYRLSSNGYLLPVPLIDARRAVQTVRRGLRTTTSIPSYCHYWVFCRRPPGCAVRTQPVPQSGCGGPDRARLQPAGRCGAGLP